MLMCLEPFLFTHQHWFLSSHSDAEILHRKGR